MGNRCNSYCRSIFVALICAMALASCDVHEFPYQVEPAAPKQLILNLNISDLSHYTTIEMGINERSRSSENTLHLIRHIIKIYPADSRKRAAYSREVVDEMEFIDREVKKNVSIPLHELEPGEYTIAAWSEYIPYDQHTDYYHDTGDFQNITLLGANVDKEYLHRGNTPYREAWRGTTSITIGKDGSLVNPEGKQTALIEMHRPMARYHFITTDLQDFLKSELSRRNYGGVPIEAPSAPGVSDVPQKAPELNDYIVVVRYAGYMPYIYNIFTDKPVDSLTGVAYMGNARQIDQNSAELAYDYVFVNGMTTSTQVQLELYSKEDRSLIASSGVINVPLVREKYTLVKGNFLTA